jgi:hypothetical protein
MLSFVAGSLVIVAVFGTTVAPWQLFFQQSSIPAGGVLAMAAARSRRLDMLKDRVGRPGQAIRVVRPHVVLRDVAAHRARLGLDHRSPSPISAELLEYPRGKHPVGGVYID